MFPALLVGRARELALLSDLAARAAAGAPQLVVVYGKRRVGKTVLTLHHLHHRRGVLHGYSPATQTSADGQRRQVYEDLVAAGIDLPDDAAQSWVRLFDALTDAALEQPITVVLDEVPYYIGSDSAWASALQRSWDRARNVGRPCHLMLIITGSAISVMTDVIASGGPLYERPNRVIRLDPLDLPTSAQLLDVDPVTMIEAHAACGGYPLLLARWNPKLTTLENLLELAGDPLGALATNANTLLLDLPDIGGHRRVISAIGRGDERQSRIRARAGQHTERSLDLLRRAGYVRQVFPVGERREANPRYVLDDIYLQYWFTLIEPKVQLIESGQGRTVVQQSMTTWNHHVARVFEAQARAHAARLVTRGDLPAMEIGDWWTYRPRQAQLDVVGLSGSGRWELVGEAKWTERFGNRQLQAFADNLAACGDRSRDALQAVWVKGSIDASVKALRPRLLHFSPAEMVAG